MLLAAWRLLSRPDLEDDDAPATPRRGWFAARSDRRCVTSPSSPSSAPCSLLALKRPFLFVLAYIYVDTVSPQRISYFLLNSSAALDDRRRAGDRRLAAARQEGQLRVAPRQGLILLLLAYAGLDHAQRRLPGRGAGEMGLGVEGAGLRHLPALHPAHQAQDRGGCCCSSPCRRRRSSSSAGSRPCCRAAATACST